MIQFLETASPEAVAVSVQGKITMDEYRKATPIILGKIAAYGQIPLMLSLKDIDMAAGKEVWGGIKGDMKQLSNLKRIALVVDTVKFKLLAQMAKPFISAEIKVFDEGEEQKAIAWMMAQEKQ